MAEHGFTPGPWAWYGNGRTREIYLATKHSGRRYVMGFRRWGMSGAQPMFQPAERGLVPADQLLTFEVGDRDVRGVEQAKANSSVYRLDISGIDCADARLIAASPTLLEACQKLDAFWLEDGWLPPHPDPDRQEERLLRKETLDVWRTIRAAIQLATGKDA